MHLLSLWNQMKLWALDLKKIRHLSGKYSGQQCCSLYVIAVIEGVSPFDYNFFTNKLALKA